MQRAIELARLADGATSPNPLVGCVIVNNNQIVGEGWHKATGLPHAEIEAINAAGNQTQGATLYVTLEPCSHHGRTPPCTDAILNAGIKTVIYAIADSNPVASEGADVLANHGVTMIADVQNADAAYLNRFYFHHLKTKRPYVIAKYASSLDGRIATRTGNSQWITGPEARLRSHSLRQSVDAILVGTQTAIDDDPELTVRLPEKICAVQNIRHPLRIVLDANARIPLDRKVLSGDLPGNTLVVTTHAMNDQHEQKLKDRGIDTLRMPQSVSAVAQQNSIDLSELVDELGKRSIQSLMVEGGQTVLGSMHDARLIDEVWAFIAPVLIGGSDAVSPIGGHGFDSVNLAPRLSDVCTEKCGNDILIRGIMNKKSENS